MIHWAICVLACLAAFAAGAWLALRFAFEIGAAVIDLLAVDPFGCLPDSCTAVRQAVKDGIRDALRGKKKEATP